MKKMGMSFAGILAGLMASAPIAQSDLMARMNAARTAGLQKRVGRPHAGRTLDYYHKRARASKYTPDRCVALRKERGVGPVRKIRRKT